MIYTERNLNRQYDVVVIGAGPAGNITAWQLAKKYKVLIVEAQSLPRYKSCSGILIGKSVDILEKQFGNIPDDVKCMPYRTNGITIVDETMLSQDFPDEGINVRRDKFDYWLTQKAITIGADCADNTRVIGIDNNDEEVVLTVKGRHVYGIHSKIVIACDGVNGTSRVLTNAPAQEKVITYQKFYDAGMALDKSKFYAYLANDFSEYDAWLNTKNDCVIIGTIAKTSAKAKYLHNQFVHFLEKKINLKICREIKAEAWCMPLVIPDFPLIFRNKRVFFAGEVAGLLNPFGEGISLALSSGLCLADACLKQKSPGLADCAEIESDYKDSLSSEIKYMKRQWAFLKEFYPSFWNNVLSSL